jgi:hypothetical protein
MASSSDKVVAVSTAPLMFTWQGDSFTPIHRHAKECDSRYVVGQTYVLEEIKDRSGASHRQYFAAINEGWKSLPDAAVEQFPTPEHLRKFALVKNGFRDERSIQCSSKAEALRVASFIRPLDEFSIVTVTSSTVTVYTAKSQSCRAMGKAEFQRSKQAVLDYIADILSTTTKELELAGNNS